MIYNKLVALSVVMNSIKAEGASEVEGFIRASLVSEYSNLYYRFAEEHYDVRLKAACGTWLKAVVSPTEVAGYALKFDGTDEPVLVEEALIAGIEDDAIIFQEA